MNSLGFEYQSDFARRYITQGRVEVILEQLASRFGPLSEEIQTRVRCAHRAQLDAVTELVLTAQTLEEALGSLC